MGFCRAPTATFMFLCVLGSYCRVLSESQQVPAMYVLGDSLLDVGNNNYLPFSFAKSNYPHYGVDYPGGKSTGRFSNGRNAADFLAEKVGLPTSPPYLSNKTGTFLQGVSFASAGAAIFNGSNDFAKNQSMFLEEQVNKYSGVYSGLVQLVGSSEAQKRLSKSVFVIVIGSNDIFNYLNSNSTNSRRQNDPQQYIDLMVSTLKTHLLRLYELGARKLLIAGVGVLGCSPGQRVSVQNQECNQEANHWSTKYNHGLRSMLQGLQPVNKDLFYSFFDVYNFFSSINQTPANYGFNETKSACCGMGKLNAEGFCTPVSSFCSNRRTHLYWDAFHPTEAAAQVFADFIYDGSQEYITPVNLKQLVAL